MSKMVFRETKPESLRPGDFRLFTKTLSDTDAMLFAGISGEMSPLYLNQSFAERTELGSRSVHPMLVAAVAGGAIFRLLSPAVSTEAREFRFLRPVYAGDTVTARAQVQSVDASLGVVTLRLDCFDQHEQQVMEGISRERLVFPAAEKEA